MNFSLHDMNPSTIKTKENQSAFNLTNTTNSSTCSNCHSREIIGVREKINEF